MADSEYGDESDFSSEPVRRVRRRRTSALSETTMIAISTDAVAVHDAVTKEP